MERKSGDDWVSACINVVVAGVRCVGRGRKSSGICREASYREKRLTLAERGRNEPFKNKW